VLKTQICVTRPQCVKLIVGKNLSRFGRKLLIVARCGGGCRIYFREPCS